MTDLIKQVGGIESAKKLINEKPKCCNCYDLMYGYGYVSSWFMVDFNITINLDDLRQAIADYNTDHCTNIENHISPSTKVIDK